jgi:hypothetical protein
VFFVNKLGCAYAPKLSCFKNALPRGTSTTAAHNCSTIVTKSTGSEVMLPLPRYGHSAHHAIPCRFLGVLLRLPRLPAAQRSNATPACAIGISHILHSTQSKWIKAATTCTATQPPVVTQMTAKPLVSCGSCAFTLATENGLMAAAQRRQTCITICQIRLLFSRTTQIRKHIPLPTANYTRMRLQGATGTSPAGRARQQQFKGLQCQQCCSQCMHSKPTPKNWSCWQRHAVSS